jgi:hypothetical protein
MAKKSSRKAQNPVDAASAATVNSNEQVSAPVSGAEGAMNMAELTLVGSKTNKKGVTTGYNYGIQGRTGSVRIPRRFFGDAEPPAVLRVDGPLVAPDAERAAKLAAKGERKAATQTSAAERASKLEQRILKANAAAAKNAAKLEKLKARIGASAPAEQAAEEQPEGETVNA